MVIYNVIVTPCSVSLVIKTIDGGQKNALLRRTNIKKNILETGLFRTSLLHQFLTKGSSFQNRGTRRFIILNQSF